MLSDCQGRGRYDASGASQPTARITSRGLGPVVTALLFAGRAGTEIDLMTVGEQLSAMELIRADAC